ncbi:TPM domain-containing protein [Alkalispirochaeta alkalica]|uniref:TPM domain-containing protein n=1 Tax=Alkalispirochaeta alkalica TaxID=46356 RepID=UPI00036E2606|nr:TPM domain-containing protein [Alkalispirochaeta alkalica]
MNIGGRRVAPSLSARLLGLLSWILLSLVFPGGGFLPGGPVLGAQVRDSLPSPKGYVSDFAGVIPGDTARQIEQIARAVADRTDAEIALVTVKSFGDLGFATVGDLGIALADAWGVGGAGSDRGVILILAVQERQIRLEVGYGLEGILPDGRAGAIIDQVLVPAFQRGRYGEGFLDATRVLAGIIGQETGVDLSDAGASTARPPERAPAPASGGNEAGQILVLVLVFFLFGGGRFIFWPLVFGRFRRGFYGGGFGSQYRGYQHRSSFHGSSFGGGFRGGGGFGGFGGGGFGGGGASRGF